MGGRVSERGRDGTDRAQQDPRVKFLVDSGTKRARGRLGGARSPGLNARAQTVQRQREIEGRSAVHGR